jgi:hypothetical protein
LKKRTKKLLSVSGCPELSGLDRDELAIDKSFLLLFFKKEGLFSVCCLSPGPITSARTANGAAHTVQKASSP